MGYQAGTLILRYFRRTPYPVIVTIRGNRDLISVFLDSYHITIAGWGGPSNAYCTSPEGPNSQKSPSELQSMFPQTINGHGFLVRGYIGGYTKLQEGPLCRLLRVL